MTSGRDPHGADSRAFAEARRAARESRLERLQRLRRKRHVALGVIVLSFVVAFAVSYVAHSRGRAANAARAAGAASSKPVPTPVPTETVAAIEGTASSAESQPASAAEPVRKETPKPAPPAPRPKPKPKPEAAPATGPQRVRIAIGAAGYEPDLVRVKAGKAVEITIGRGEGCAAGFLMPQLGISKDNSSGPVTIRLRSPKRGTYWFTCGMGMVSGRLVVE